MSKTLEKAESLKTKIEEKSRELEATESDLETKIGTKKKEIEEMEKALQETQWEERLKKVEKELVPFYGKKRDKEDEINREINKLFNNASKNVEKINLVFKDLKELKKKISNLEKELIRKSGDDNSQMRQAVEFKKAEVIRKIEVTQQIRGGSSLVRAVNIATGREEELEGDLFGSGFNELSIYAQNIYDEIRLSRGRPVNARVDEWIRVARIPEPRIIKARAELKKNLEILKKKGLIEYEEDDDTLTVRENTIKKEG